MTRVSLTDLILALETTIEEDLVERQIVRGADGSEIHIMSLTPALLFLS